MATVRTAANRGLDLLFPPVCVGCGWPGHPLCPTCAQTVQPIGDAICARCGRHQMRPVASCVGCVCGQGSALDLVRTAGVHADVLREAIRALKYDGRTDLAEPLANYLWATHMRPPWIDLHIDAVVPAPLHAQRFADRGYNQAELLARHFCGRVGLSLETGWLTRTRETQQQVHLSAAERRVNVADAFAASPAVRGRALLIIDDVFTTGSTMHACAEAAKRAGAHAVYGMALASPAFHSDTADDAPSDP